MKSDNPLKYNTRFQNNSKTKISTHVFHSEEGGALGFLSSPKILRNINIYIAKYMKSPRFM